MLPRIEKSVKKIEKKIMAGTEPARFAFRKLLMREISKPALIAESLRIEIVRHNHIILSKGVPDSDEKTPPENSIDLPDAPG